jgi:Protein of unknown function (DUF4054)
MSIEACAPIPVTPGIVVFDPTDFQTRYPAFATVSDAALQQNFNQATLMLENSCCSIVKDAPTREILLNLATAHITALLNGVNGQPPQGIVGRVSSAQEGSVSVQAEMLTQSMSAAYWMQTPWGAAFWQMTLPFRTARYIPPSGGVGFGYDDAWNAWPQ